MPVPFSFPMNVILVMVVSADGKTSKWDDTHIHDWSSAEDHAHFERLKSSHRVLVMGRKTYETVKDTIRLTEKLRRIVITRSPDDYKDLRVHGQLEFTDETPAALVERLHGEGYAEMLLAGGSEVNDAFLASGLITECYITVEPRFFGSGRSMFAGSLVDIPLRLMETRQLNDRGTLVLHYTVAYDHQTG